MKIKPYPYQIEALKAINHFRGRSLIAHDMGLGKTLIALWWWRKYRRKASPAVIVCPAAVKYHWEREAVEQLGAKAIVLEGRDSRRLNEDVKLVILNYDILPYWINDLRKLKAKLLVLDECQMVKSPQRLRTKAVRLLAKGVPYLLALSGTPLMNRPIELFTVLQLLKPKQYNSRRMFEDEFCGVRWTPWGWKADGASNIPRLHKRLKETCMIRRLKSEVLEELPPKTRRVLAIDMIRPDEYREADDHFLEWLEKQDPAKLRGAERATGLVKLGYLKRLAARLKARFVVEWINQWLEEYPNEKLVVFAIHRGMINLLAGEDSEGKRRLNAENVVIDGRTASRRRQILVDRFQEDRGIRLLIGNIQAAGVGLTLTASSTVAFTELSWVPADHIQAEDRIHRIGQKQVSWIWYLVARGTIEEDLCSILERKQRIVSSVLDGGKNTGGLDVYQQLMARYSKLR